MRLPGAAHYLWDGPVVLPLWCARNQPKRLFQGQVRGLRPQGPKSHGRWSQVEPRNLCFSTSLSRILRTECSGGELCSHADSHRVNLGCGLQFCIFNKLERSACCWSGGRTQGPGCIPPFEIQRLVAWILFFPLETHPHCFPHSKSDKPMLSAGLPSVTATFLAYSPENASSHRQDMLWKRAPSTKGVWEMLNARAAGPGLGG